MSITEPIRQPDEVKSIINFYLKRSEMRNCCLISFGLYSALRISDMLGLKWKDVYDFEKDKFRERVSLIEQKTQKFKQFALNSNAVNFLLLYKNSMKDLNEETYIFRSRKGENNPISREQAYKIVKYASLESGIEGNISCHSLRKTFGYYAWKSGVQPAVLMNIYNHSSFSVTEKYLCIDQDDRDKVYLSIEFY